MSKHATPYTRALVRQLHLLGCTQQHIANIAGITVLSVSNISREIKSENDLYPAAAKDLGIDLERVGIPSGWRVVELFVSLVEIRAKAIMIERGLSK